MNYDSKFLESQFLNDEINEELQDLNEGVLGNVVKNIVRSIKNKFSKANGKETHYRETLKKDKEKEHKSQAPKFKEPAKEVQDGRDAFVKEVYSKTSPLIKRIVSRYPLLKGCIGAIEYDTNSIDDFVYWGEYDLAVAYYDIWEHEDVKADKVRARASTRNTSDAEKPSVWTDEFVDQFNHAVEDIEKEVTKLGYGECELDCDWDDGQFTLYIPDKVVKEYVDKYLKDHPISEEYVQNEELVDFLEQVVQEASSPADDKAIIESNKKTMENIMKEIFPEACKVFDKVKTSSKQKYLADKEYALPDGNHFYNYDIKYEGADFGRMILFKIDTRKLNDDINWNAWEDDVFKLCSELNKLPIIKQYGHVSTEQPDDGDQIWMNVKHEFLMTPKDLEERKKKYEEEQAAERKRREEELKKYNEELEKFKALEKKYKPEFYKYCDAAVTEYAKAIKSKISSSNIPKEYKNSIKVCKIQSPWVMYDMLFYVNIDIDNINIKDKTIKETVKEIAAVCSPVFKNLIKPKFEYLQYYGVLYSDPFSYNEVTDKDTKNILNKAGVKRGIIFSGWASVDARRYFKDKNITESGIEEFSTLIDKCHAIHESLQNEPVNADIKRNMQEVEDTEKYNNPTHGEDNLANGDEDVLAVMDKVTTNVHGTLFGAGTDDSLVYDGAYDSYMADILDNERCLAKALRLQCGLSESSYSILNEARIQDTIKEKWEKFVNFINRIDDRFYSAMEKILLQQKDYLEKYEDIINNKKPREDLEYEYEGDYIEGIDRCMNTPVPIFNYERDAKWLRQEGYEGAIKDFMAGKNFKYNKDEELAQQFKNWFIAAERGTTKGKFSNLNFKAMYQFCYKYQDIEAMVKKDQTALDQSTNILINAVNKALRERGESTTQDQTAKSDTNTTTAGASAKNNASAANNGGNTAATPNTTTSTTESYWMPLDEADNNANNNGNNNKSSGLTIKTNTPNKTDANGNVKQKDVTAAGDSNTTSQDMNNILNKWIAMCKALITAKLTCTQKIARDYMKLIKAHVRSYGGKGTVDNKNGENTTEKSNAEVSQNQQEENKTEQK